MVLSCAEGACDTCGGDIRKAAFADLLEPYGYDGSDYYGRAGFDEHCNVEKEPNEPNRFDWVVETDPYEPPSTPVKRTALGRMAHEASMVVHNKDGKVVVYMGVDDCFEYTYSFVCKAAFDPARPESGKNILDDGVLSVARVNADGIMNGLPRVHGVGPLTAEKGFASQADVLLRTRLAADAVGPTPMDRPEDMETNPAIGRVYAIMTKNKKMAADKLNPANTPPENLYGHIVELIPPDGGGKDADHTADTYSWDLFVLAGNPRDAKHGAKFHPATSENGWFVNPGNLTFDPKGHALPQMAKRCLCPSSILLKMPKPSTELKPAGATSRTTISRDRLWLRSNAPMQKKWAPEARLRLKQKARHGVPGILVPGGLTAYISSGR